MAMLEPSARVTEVSALQEQEGPAGVQAAPPRAQRQSRISRFRRPRPPLLAVEPDAVIGPAGLTESHSVR